MSICTDIAERREKCLTYIVENYKQWPAECTLSPSAASHHGYNWRKLSANGPWVLHGRDNVITEADYICAYYDAIRMSDHFETSATAKANMCHLFEFEDDDEIKLTVSVAQHRAMFHAISCYDGMKAKLKHARLAALQLNRELGE